MRLATFSIERYGAFERRELSFSGTHGLSVVYGPNEAGKSTFLSAIGDFLFGIPPQSPHGTFGYDAMRLNVTMGLADGTELSLRRRKGRGVTLSDAAGVGVDDGVLARVLGATGRDRFETLFGLNHETLRAGGNRLLAAEGEIGRLIVEAGGGLRALVDRMSALDGEIDGLFATRRSGDRAFYKAYDALDAADRLVKSSQLTREAYEEAEGNSRSATERYEQGRNESRELAQRVAALERMIRVVPALRELAREVERYELHADLPELPEEFEQQVRDALAAQREATKALEAAQRGHDSLKAHRDALVVDARWDGLQRTMEDGNVLAVHVRKARQDRPNRLNDLEVSEGRLSNLRRLLGLTDEDSIEQRLPKSDRLNLVQRLHAAGIELGPTVTAKRERVRDLESDVELLRGRLEAAREKGFGVPFGASASDFAALPITAAGFAARTSQNEDERSAIDAAAKALGFSTLEELRSFDAPDADAIQTQIDRDAARRSAEEREGDRARDAQTTMDAAQREIDRLKRGGEVPTEAAIALARSERSAALEPLRSEHLEGRHEGDPEERRSQVDALDHAIGHADALVDRRSAEAQRVASLEQEERRFTEAHATREAATKEGERIADLAEKERSAFATLFPEAFALRADLPRLKKLVQDGIELLRRAEASENEASELKRQLAEFAPHTEALKSAEAKAGRSPVVDEPLASRVQTLMAAIASHDQGHAEYLRDAREHEDATAELDQVRLELTGLEEQQREWSVHWRAGLVDLGIEPEASFERAGLVLREWATAVGELSNLSQINRRLERIAEDETALATLVKEVADRFGLAMSDPVAATEQAKELWEQNEQSRIERASLDPEVERAEAECRSAEEAKSDGAAELRRLRATARASDDESLLATAHRNSQRQLIAVELGRIRRTITAAGDGLSVDNLTAQWAERDLDALKAERAELRADELRLEEELRAAVEAMQTARSALEAFQTAEGIGRAFAERESAAAEMQAVVERWLELTLARELITRAIAEVRNEQQDPLIRRAGELFALTTRGAFAGVGTDVDAKGHPVVVGRRTNGSVANVSELSDGTRDQLFLSFRLASLERYASAAEPLPFIADDILVHFDDERAAATLELLAAFGGTNQVLLFTHHKSVRDEALRLSKSLPVEVLELAL